MMMSYSTTNEVTWALILGLVKDIAPGDTRIKSSPSGWQAGLSSKLAGRTLALLGLGNLGTQAAVTGILGFGMNVIAWSTSLTQEKADEAAKSRGLPAGSFKVVTSKKELFEQADILSVHYVLSERSKGIVTEAELSVMKKSAFLVNTSRGPLIEESALVKVLEAGAVRGAGLDVFDIEPLPKDSPWRKADYWGTEGRGAVLLSPHMGYVEEGVMNGMYKSNAESLRQWLAGEPVEGIMT
jgi:phosphoglycerate dehydrogenase-like enzyme